MKGMGGVGRCEGRLQSAQTGYNYFHLGFLVGFSRAVIRAPRLRQLIKSPAVPPPPAMRARGGRWNDSFFFNS